MSSPTPISTAHDTPALRDVFARRPALTVAVLFVLGIVMHRVLPAVPGVWMGLMVLCITGSMPLIRHSVFGAFPVGMAIILGGVSAGQLAGFYYPRNHIGAFAANEPRLAWLEVRVADTPRVVTPEGKRHVPPHQTFSANLLRVRTVAGWEAATGTVMVSVSQPVEWLQSGQHVRLLGTLQRPPRAMNPGQFDWSAYYRSQRVIAELHVSHPSSVGAVSPGGGSGSGSSPEGGPGLLERLREAARNALSRGFGPDREVDRALLTALVFGERGPALHGVEEQFRRTGTTHLLASTGLRVAVLAGCVYLLCRLLCLSPRKTVIIVISVVILWGSLTMPAPQAIRPVLLCAAVGFATLVRRVVDGIHLLAVAALAILIVNPLDLYNAGFQLSFVTVLGMMMFTRPVLEFVRRYEDPDARVARQIERRLGRPARLQRARWAAAEMVREALVAGVVAWFVSMPLVAFHFEQFNLWAIPIGLLLSPLVFASLVAAFLKIVLTALLPHWAAAWAAAASGPAVCLRYAVGWAAKIPLDDIPITSPPAWLVVAYFALLFAPLLMRWRWGAPGSGQALVPVAPTRTLDRPAGAATAVLAMPSPRRRGGPRLQWCARCSPVVGCLLLLLMPPAGRGGGAARARAAKGELRVTLLSIGAGQCAAVELPDGRVAMIDAGSSTVSDVVHTCLGPFLRHAARDTIDQIYLSHGDYDHISAVFDAVPAYGVREVLTSPCFRRHANDSGPAEALIEMLDRSGHSPRLIWAGQTLDLGAGAQLEVLWPPPDSRMNSNNTGLVLRLTYAGRSVLFPADIQELAERELLRDPRRLRSDVLVAPHHGSSESTTPAFVRAVGPRIILSSNAEKLTAKQRTFEREIDGRPLYRTHHCGALTLTIAPDGRLVVTPFLVKSQQPGEIDATAGMDLVRRR